MLVTLLSFVAVVVEAFLGLLAALFQLVVDVVETLLGLLATLLELVVDVVEPLLLNSPSIGYENQTLDHRVNSGIWGLTLINWCRGDEQAANENREEDELFG